MKSINFSAIDAKWQKEWEKVNAFEAKEDSRKQKYYLLEMYPYPSSNGLHMGHAFNYTLGDILARYKRMKGFSVLHPMGFDSFGLPAENAAIKDGTHPQKYTDKAIENFVRQQKALGLSYDWSRKIQSHDHEYYKWNQYLFLQFLKKGLVYRKESGVNWCSNCESVLANEQVHEGKCWRHKDTNVIVKQLEQWFVKTTKYAEELLRDVDKLDWPERIKIMQRNWIGKSEGVTMKFKVKDLDIAFETYDSVPQTFMAQTFTVIAPESPFVYDLVKGTPHEKEVMKFVDKIKQKKIQGRFDIDKDMEGIFTGRYLDYTVGKRTLPIWVASFVVADYGTGIVNCSAHDERDFAFAKKYGLPLHPVMFPADKKEAQKVKSLEYAYVKDPEGILEEPHEFKGRRWGESREDIIEHIEDIELGKRTTNHKLRDWLISRQRYWGTPIPIIYCDDCGVVPVPEKDLPVLLPQKVEFGKGNPLLTNEKFVNVKCPACGKKARRETDTMDTFFDSSWYFLRFTDPTNKKQPLSPDCVSYWMPVDFYTGGAEHACMHLIYARFFTKALRDLGYLRFDEPFPKLFNQGMVHGADGFVMSKSRGNGIDPLDVTKKYGADTLRLFLVSMASPDKDSVWSDTGVESMSKFVRRVWEYAHSVNLGKSSVKFQHKLNKTILQVSKEIENLNYNMAVIKLRTLFDSFEEEVSKEDFTTYLKLLSPFAPHFVDEIGKSILSEKTFISLSEWPVADESKIDDGLDKAEEVFEKTVADIQNVLKIVRDKSGKDLRHVYLYAIPSELGLFDVSLLKSRVGLDVSVFAVNDKKKYDPESKSAKAKPGKPAIYVE